MRILVTNDDGIFSPGLLALAEVASRFGQVRVVAPDVEQSAMGHAITIQRPLQYHRVKLDSFEAYRVNGTPAGCVGEILRHKRENLPKNGCAWGLRPTRTHFSELVRLRPEQLLARSTFVTTLVRTTLDRDLRAIRDDLLRMGDLLDAAIQRSLRALATRDSDLARQIVADDAHLNALRFRIEEACVALIATQQPAASDLRAVIATMIIVSELERMGDYAAGIAKTVLRMENEPLLKPLLDMPRMAGECRNMVRRALDAYVARDAALARAVAAQDDVIDHLYNQIFRELMSFIVEDPRTTTRALYLLFSAHNLERIGDRAVNISERVIFMTNGELKELNAGPDAPL